MVQNLPTAEVYEKEFKYMPWGKLVSEVESFVVENARKEGKLLDLLCGPGYLLGKIASRRPDLDLLGIDLEPQFISHAKEKYPGVSFTVADVSKWQPAEKYDVIVCTAGVHHLRYEEQEAFMENVSKALAPSGFAIFGDPYIDDYSNEQERQLAGAKLGYEYLAETIKNGGTPDVVEAAIGVLSNDVLLVEYKSSVKKMKPLLERHFKTVDEHKTWPAAASGYGDYYFILRND